MREKMTIVALLVPTSCAYGVAGPRLYKVPNLDVLPRCVAVPWRSRAGGDDLLNMGHGSAPTTAPGTVPRTVPGPGLMGGSSQVSTVGIVTFFSLFVERLFLLSLPVLEGRPGVPTPRGFC